MKLKRDLLAGVFGAVTNGSADVIWEEILFEVVLFIPSPELTCLVSQDLLTGVARSLGENRSGQMDLILTSSPFVSPILFATSLVQVGHRDQTNIWPCE